MDLCGHYVGCPCQVRALRTLINHPSHFTLQKSPPPAPCIPDSSMSSFPVLDPASKASARTLHQNLPKTTMRSVCGRALLATGDPCPFCLTFAVLNFHPQDQSFPLPPPPRQQGGQRVKSEHSVCPSDRVMQPMG